MPPKGSGRHNRRPSITDEPPRDDRPAAGFDLANSSDTDRAKSAPPESSAEAKPDRVSVTLKSDGTVDWDAMRPSTQDRIRKAFGTMPAGATVTAADAVSPMLVAALVGSISTLAIGIARMTGHTLASSEAMRLTDVEKGELIPLWTAAINDYGLLLGRHQNLIVAAAATGLMFLPRVQALERLPKGQGTVKPA